MGHTGTGTGQYKGFFEDTGKGHAVCGACGWSQYAYAQVHQNNLALTLGGAQTGGTYSYGDCLAIVEAGIANNKPILLWWWDPDFTTQKWQLKGNEAYRFEAVTLPQWTETCEAARPNETQKCSGDHATMLGPPGGGCDQKAEALLKTMTSSLEKYNPAAFKFLRGIQISNPAVNEMLVNWRAYKSGTWNVAPRHAVCKWLHDNLNEGESMASQVPLNLPKTITVNKDDSATEFLLLILGIIGIVVNVLIYIWLYRNRKEKIVQRSQTVFLKLVIVGGVLLNLTVGLAGQAPSDALCGAQIWIGHIGYILLFVPLLMKLYRVAILFNNTKMKKLKMTAGTLLKRMGVLLSIISAYLLFWTLFAPSAAKLKYDGVMSLDSTVVTQTLACSSDTPVLGQVVIAFEFLILLWGVSLCVQTRGVSEDFAETKYIAFGIYNTTFVALICLILLFGFDSPPQTTALVTGFGVFFATLVVELMMFVPKIIGVANGVETNIVQGMTKQSSMNSAPSNSNPTRNVKKNQVKSYDA